MSEKVDNPRVFISYSWTTQKYQQYVLSIATRLVENGVDVIIDKWDLQEGSDKYQFMETMVTDKTVSKVLLMCDQQYQEKADSRKSGVGEEALILSKEVYSSVGSTKFIPVITEKDSEGNPFLPTFVSGRIWVDLTDGPHFFMEFEKLLRAIFGKPLEKKPPLGSAPSFVTEGPKTRTGTTHKFQVFKDALLNGKPNIPILFDDYLKTFSTVLGEFQVTSIEGQELDQIIYDSISEFKYYRDELIETADLALKYTISAAPEKLFKILEEILAFTEPKQSPSYIPNEYDNYRFIARELFLYFIALCVKNNKFDALDSFLTEKYRYQGNHDIKLKNFTVFNMDINSIDSTRNNRLELKLISLTSDLIIKRADLDIVSSEELLQADFLLALRSILTEKLSAPWFPRMLLYKQGGFELFQRAEAPKGFEAVKFLLHVENKSYLENIFSDAEKTYNLSTWSVGNFGQPIEFRRLMNFDKLYAES